LVQSFSSLCSSHWLLEKRMPLEDGNFEGLQREIQPAHSRRKAWGQGLCGTGPIPQREELS